MSGLHHVTAIAGDPIRNFGFYTRDLGLRFVKKTVNFDDPGTYHFYYGDETGRPGTILTFFPWAGAPPDAVASARPIRPRSACRSVRSATGPSASSRRASLMKRWRSALANPCCRSPIRTAWRWPWSASPAPRTSRAGAMGDVPVEHAIRGFHGVTLLLDSAAKTAAVLTDVFGFKETAREGSVIRFKAPGDVEGSVVDIYEAKGFLRGHQGGGSVHHIAFRAADDAEQGKMAQKARPQSWPASHRAAGPQLLPLDLLPRARRRAVRDRDRHPRLRRR